MLIGQAVISTSVDNPTTNLHSLSHIMNTFSIDDQLVMLIDRLNDAVNVCYEAPEIEDQGYPYATGYSRSAMKEVSDSLSSIVKQLREENV